MVDTRLQTVVGVCLCEGCCWVGDLSVYMWGGGVGVEAFDSVRY